MNVVGSSRCGSCGKEAPTVLRGMQPYCAICGASRFGLSTKPLNLVGRPSKWGGSVARGAGWVLLAMGMAVGLVLLFLLQAIWPAGTVGYLVGVPVMALTLAIWATLFFGGKKLQEQGAKAERDARLDAVRTLAKHRGGALTAQEVAQSLAMGLTEADEMLTSFAKDPEAEVGVDFDENGILYYLFGRSSLGTIESNSRARVRIDEPSMALDARQEDAEDMVPPEPGRVRRP